LDKLLELIANFSFLVIGISVALAGAWLPSEWRSIGMVIALSLLIFPLLYMILILTGRQPLQGLIHWLPSKIGQNWFFRNLRVVEGEMSRFCTTHPVTVIVASLISIGLWVGMIGEYWLLTWFLGLRLTLSETISAMVAARLSFLTPLPGGLGVFEASQMLAMRLLGQPESAGLALALIIRFRDLLFGVIGLLGAVTLIKGNPLKSSSDG
jgi:uncharacterized membrane protein YbhN (UPF0104 family)